MGKERKERSSARPDQILEQTWVTLLAASGLAAGDDTPPNSLPELQYLGPQQYSQVALVFHLFY